MTTDDKFDKRWKNLFWPMFIGYHFVVMSILAFMPDTSMAVDILIGVVMALMFWVLYIMVFSVFGFYFKHKKP
jgi:hypothetical protein